jgi:hypothetical protein
MLTEYFIFTSGRAGKVAKDACADTTSYWSTKHRVCYIRLHPKKCEKPEIAMCVNLLNHELMHDILSAVVGEDANKKWDKIVYDIGDYLGNYCPCEEVYLVSTL